MGKIVLIFALWAQTLWANELQEIQKFYKNVTEMESEILQLKEASYLINPIESQISFKKYQDGTVDWKVIKPYQSHIQLKNGKIQSLDKQEIVKNTNAQQSQQVQEILKIIQALTTANFDVLNETFHLEIKDLVIKAKPKAQVKSFPYMIEMQFAADKLIKNIVLESSAEKITLKFNNLKLKKI